MSWNVGTMVRVLFMIIWPFLLNACISCLFMSLVYFVEMLYFLPNSFYISDHRSVAIPTNWRQCSVFKWKPWGEEQLFTGNRRSSRRESTTFLLRFLQFHLQHQWRPSAAHLQSRRTSTWSQRLVIHMWKWLCFKAAPGNARTRCHLRVSWMRGEVSDLSWARDSWKRAS